MSLSDYPAIIKPPIPPSSQTVVVNHPTVANAMLTAIDSIEHAIKNKRTDLFLDHALFSLRKALRHTEEAL